MAVLRYKVDVQKQNEAKQDKQMKDKQIRASKQATVNNAMMTKVPSAVPAQQIQQNPAQQQGWGNV